MNDIRKKNSSSASLAFVKLLAIFILFVQVFRMIGVGLTVFAVYDALIVKQETLNMFDPGLAGMNGPENNVTKRDLLGHDLTDEDEEPTQGTSVWEIWWNDTKDRILLSIPCVEVVTSVTLVYFVMGPLSPRIAITQWILWLLKMRVFWMRLLWTATAIAYSFVTIAYNKEMFKISSNEKYVDSPEKTAVLGVISLEYFCLGLLQCTMKIMPFTVVCGKIRKTRKELSWLWVKFLILCYYLCVFAFALRNFSMSLYFGLLCAFVNENNNDDPDGQSRFKGVVIVVQVYLALIRGKFYGFFMRDFLSTFLVEEDDERFEEVQREETYDEEKILLRRKPAANGAETQV